MANFAGFTCFCHQKKPVYRDVNPKGRCYCKKPCKMAYHLYVVNSNDTAGTLKTLELGCVKPIAYVLQHVRATPLRHFILLSINEGPSHALTHFQSPIDDDGSSVKCHPHNHTDNKANVTSHVTDLSM